MSASNPNNNEQRQNKEAHTDTDTDTHPLSDNDTGMVCFSPVSKKKDDIENSSFTERLLQTNTDSKFISKSIHCSYV